VPTPLVELTGVGVRLGNTPVLAGVSLSLAAGEVVGLVGANGSGKTTLLRLVATLLRPSAGQARVLGADLGSEERYQVRPRIALIGHQPALYAELSLQENSDFAAAIRGIHNGRAAEVIDLVGLAGARHRLAGACSHGMLRRAEFARALLLEPDLLLLDEAHAGLDPSAAGLVETVVRTVTARGGGAIVVSHEPNRIGAFVDRTELLDDGKLEALRP